MFKILKKNQIIIYVIALMLVAAGYLNYTTDNKLIETSAEPEITYKENIADIGDATLVNSNSVNSENSVVNLSENNEDAKVDDTIEDSTINSGEIDNEKNEQVQTTASNTEEYFSKSKLERDTMYSQMLETYQNILNSKTVSEEQRNIATQEITNIQNTKNAIMICENLLSTKGFSKNVIFVNDNSVSVVINVDGELAINQVAQIQNIISREMNVEVGNIHITEKN